MTDAVVEHSWLMTFCVGLLTCFLVHHFLKIRGLPPGPFPFPIIGNLLSFRHRAAADVVRGLRQHYGDVFTIWLGSMPFVVVTGLSQTKEALLERGHDFAGRPNLHTISVFLNGNSSIADSDYGEPWKALRKMGNAAIRKFAVSENLPPLVDGITKETVEKMLREVSPFNPRNHLYLLIANIISSSLFGQRFQIDDPEFLAYSQGGAALLQQFGTGSVGDFVPVLRPFYWGVVQRIKQATVQVVSMMSTKLKQHIASYESGVIRDMVDSLLSAREEVISQGKGTAAHLSDDNMNYAIFDIFSGSIDPTHSTVRWIVLYLASYQDIQEKVIQELRDQIGDRLPVQEDRKRCPYTSAVITESLRIRNETPFGLPHKAICDSQIGGYKVPMGTNVVFHLNAIHNDPRHWENPERFYPERFLEKDGSHTEKRLDKFLPFGQGRRNCMGEKLAIVEMFMILAGIFRRCRIILKEPPEDMQPSDLTLFSFPKDHKILAIPLEE